MYLVRSAASLGFLWKSLKHKPIVEKCYKILWFYLNSLESTWIYLNLPEFTFFKTKGLTDRPTEGPKDQQTDKASHRVPMQNLKKCDGVILRSW